MGNDVAGHLAAWIITYAIHSSLLIGLGAVLAGECRRRGAIAREEAVWRLAVLGGPVTATAQAVAPSAWLGGAGTLQAMWMTLPGLPDGVASAGVGLPAPSWPMALLVVLGTATLVQLCRWRLRRSRLDAYLSCRSPAPPWMRRMMDELAGASGFDVRPRLSIHPGLSSPVVFGILRPEITLPRLAVTEGPEAIRPMLAHELAHILDRDPLWRALLDLMDVLFPWQLLLRPVRRRLEVIAELRCDSRAALWTGAQPLAWSLVTAAGWMRASERELARRIDVLALAGSGSLAGRVDRLLDGSHAWNGPGGRFVVLLLVSVGLLGPVLPGVCATPLDSVPAGPPVARELPALPDASAARPLVIGPGARSECHRCGSREESGRHHKACSQGGCKHGTLE